MDETLNHVELIREAFHYQSRFKKSTMVFKIDFPVTEHPLFTSMVKDLALLAKSGFRIVIVPGAKECIDAILQKYEVPSLHQGSIRVTSAQAMPFVQMAAFNSASSFLTRFSGNKVEAVIGNFVRARGAGVINGTDTEHSGTVDRFYKESLRRVLELGIVPILPCMGWSASGKPYNVPSDEIALSAAKSLGAEKLFIVSLSGGVRKGTYQIPDTIEASPSGRLARLTPREAASVLELNAAGNHENDKPLTELSLALQASRTGVERVHIIDGEVEGAILQELFTNLGSGTMIYTDEYESICALRSRDIPDILRLMSPLMQQGILLKRTADDIELKKDDYAVFVIDGQIRACGALHNWGEDQGEIAAIATDPAYSDMGLGRRIIRYLIDKAKQQGLKRVFVLTTKTQDWFESLGFREAATETLPEKKRRLYDHSRNSKVFALTVE